LFSFFVIPAKAGIQRRASARHKNFLSAIGGEGAATTWRRVRWPSFPLPLRARNGDCHKNISSYNAVRGGVGGWANPILVVIVLSSSPRRRGSISLSFVIPENSLFCLYWQKCEFIRNPIWFLVYIEPSSPQSHPSYRRKPVSSLKSFSLYSIKPKLQTCFYNRSAVIPETPPVIPAKAGIQSAFPQ